ncbi:MAG: diguanylate cyclase [Sedimenticola sp.]|nr:diguanylate cyclase [Sedimenticola sp.]
MSVKKYQTNSVLIIEPAKLYKEMIQQQLDSAGLGGLFVDSLDDALLLEDLDDFKLVCFAEQLDAESSALALTRLRTQLNDSMPILLITASSESEVVKQALLAGATEVINRGRLQDMQIYLADVAKKTNRPRTRSAKILYIEDSEAVAGMTQVVLKAEGYEVSCFNSAEDAVDIMSREAFDLVITDILLEGQMTGIGLIRHIRSLPSPDSQIPILAVSGLDKASQKIEALRQGATEFIEKPVLNEELIVRVRNLLKAKNLQDKVTEQEQMLRTLAVTDPLTGLFNRHYLADIATRRIKEAQRKKMPLSLIVLDIDLFKKINDIYGHLIGDAVLKRIGKLLLTSCRDEDFGVRFGGEEFILVLPNCKLSDALKRAEEIRSKIEQLKPEGLTVTGSFGVAALDWEAKSTSFSELFQAADLAVYESKQKGRNRVSKAV